MQIVGGDQPGFELQPGYEPPILSYVKPGALPFSSLPSLPSRFFLSPFLPPSLSSFHLPSLPPSFPGPARLSRGACALTVGPSRAAAVTGGELTVRLELTAPSVEGPTVTYFRLKDKTG